MVWLVVFSAAGALVEVGELGLVSVVGAGVWNLIIGRTARLWTSSRLVAAIPLMAWCIVVGLVSFSPASSGDILKGAIGLTVAVCVSGLLGGLWPLVRMPRRFTERREEL